MQALGHHHHHHHHRRWGSGSIQEASPYTAMVAAPLPPPPPPPPPPPSSSSTTRLGLPTSSSALVYSSHALFSSSSSSAAAATNAYRHSNNNSRKNGRTDISDDEKEEIRMAFELFDTKKAGKLSYRELKLAMRALDFDVKKADVKRLMEEHTKDGNSHEVDMHEFMEILSLKYKDRDPDEELAKAFKFFDEEGTGKITLKNLRKVARDLGEHISDEELGAMIEEFDNDQDGGINEMEFYNIMKRDDFDD